MADFIEDVLNNNKDDKKKSKVVKKRKTEKVSKEEKQRIKLEKQKAKEIIKKKKIEEKAFRKSANAKTENDLYKSLTENAEESTAEKEKYAKAAKTNEPKPRKNFSLFMREWPIKMLKECHKIKWASKRDIAFKFLWVVIFVVLFGTLFYFADWGVSSLFMYLKIV